MKRFVSAVVLSVAALLASTIVLAAVDINTASESQLESLPGIGPGKAKAIIAERQANGPFKSVDDLVRVKGIGDKTIAQLRAQASVGAPATGTASGGRDSPAPTGGFPLGWVVVALLAAGAIGWFFLRRRSTGPTAASAPAHQPDPAPPIAHRQAPPAPGASGQPPKPAGPSAGVAAGAKAPSAAASGPPPTPAGPKPAGQPAPAAHPKAPSGPPPAPAGPKRKDT
jgi:comEA protein